MDSVDFIDLTGGARAGAPPSKRSRETLVERVAFVDLTLSEDGPMALAMARAAARPPRQQQVIDLCLDEDEEEQRQQEAYQQPQQQQQQQQQQQPGPKRSRHLDTAAVPPLPPPAPPSLGSGATQRCDICFDDVPTVMMHSFEACAHTFCLPCLREYVAGKAAERVFPVPCPLPDCKAPISATECALVLTPEEQQALGQAEAEAALGDGVRLHCPNPRCSMLLLADDKRSDQEMECPYCSQALCAACGVLWHEGITCQQVQSQPGNLHSAEDQALLEAAEREGWKRCPDCGCMVERTEGCSHMTCKCRCTFCYSCGRKKNAQSGHYCDCVPQQQQWAGRPGVPLPGVPLAAGRGVPMPARVRQRLHQQRQQQLRLAR